MTVYVPAAAAVLKQVRVDAQTNEHKAALKLLGVLPLQGKVLTADALFTHRDFAQAVRDGGGDSILIVKDNQPVLKAQIQAALHQDADFSPYQRKQKQAQEQTARTTPKGHGRQEIRTLLSTTALSG